MLNRNNGQVTAAFNEATQIMLPVATEQEEALYSDDGINSARIDINSMRDRDNRSSTNYSPGRRGLQSTPLTPHIVDINCDAYESAGPHSPKKDSLKSPKGSPHKQPLPALLSQEATTGLKQVSNGPKFARREGPADPTIRQAFAQYKSTLQNSRKLHNSNYYDLESVGVKKRGNGSMRKPKRPAAKNHSNRRDMADSAMPSDRFWKPLSGGQVITD